MIPRTINGPFEFSSLSCLSLLQRWWVIVFGMKGKCEQLSQIKYGFYYRGTFYVTRDVPHPDPIDLFDDALGGNEEAIIGDSA